jgi:exodeoxyribonuclease V beta subunit
MASKTPITFNVLDRSLSIHQHHLIEASAGTGKTFSIENLVTRFLVEHSDNDLFPVTIDKILIVTFTRAAASDLRLRIRSRIDQTLTFLASPDSDCPDYVLSWMEQGEEFIDQAKKKLEQALFHFDQAPIFTIHGFCSKMLRRYALESKMSLDAVGGEESLPTTELLEVIHDFFRTSVTLDAYSPAQLDILLKGDPDQRKLLNLLRKNSPIVSLRPFSALLPLFQETMHRLKDLFSLTASALIDEFVQQAPSYRNHKSGETKADTLKKIERFAALFDKDSWGTDDFDLLLSDGLTWVDALQPSLIKSKSPPPLRYPELTAKLQEELYPIIHEARHFPTLLARLAHGCKQMLDRYQQEKERLNPDDLLTKMFDALADEMFSNNVRSLFHAAIIDEFQDTDPLQWQIFRRLFLNHPQEWPGYLYLVGDPKQSIYAFRQADIYTYLAAGDALGKDSTVTLNTNYRSQSSLVHALNTLFSNENTPDWIPLPRLATSLKYQPVNPSPSTPARQFDDSKEALHFFLADHKPEECEKNAFFPFIANEIIRLTQTYALPYSHFAVLIKDRYQGARLAAFLNKQNIPFVNQRSGSLADSAAIPALIDLLQAALHPRDISSVKTALGGCLISWSEKQVAQFNETTGSAALLQFYALRQHLLYSGFASFFQHFLQTEWHEDGKNAWERILSQEGGLDLYHDLQQIADVLTEEQQSLQLSPERLISLLDQFAVWEENDDKRSKRRQDSTKEGVQILTLHSSKGLEFGIVFALGLANRSSLKEDLIPAQYGQERVLIPIDDESNEAYVRYCEEIDAEKMRQLYVAMTRAKNRLYIPVALHGKKNMHIGEASPMELFLARFRRGPIGVGDRESLYARIREEDGSALTDFIEQQGKSVGISYSIGAENSPQSPQKALQTETFSLNLETAVQDDKVMQDFELESLLMEGDHSQKVKALPIRSDYGSKDCVNLSSSTAVSRLKAPPSVSVITLSFTTASFTALASQQQKQPNRDTPPPHDFQSTDKTQHTLPAGSETGILLHQILEKIPFHAFKELTSAEKSVEWITPFVKGSPLEGWKEAIGTIILNTLKAPLVPGFCLADLQPSQMYREMPFLFPCEESFELEELETSPGFLKGVIDLIFIWNGKYYIVDWKSNWLGEDFNSYGQEKLEQAMHHHQYFLQANIYSEAWRRYLQLVDPRPFEECFGGVIYLFLRGVTSLNQHSTGIYSFLLKDNQDTPSS